MDFKPKPNHKLYFNDRTEQLSYNPAKATPDNPYAGYNLVINYRNGKREILDGIKAYATAVNESGQPVADDLPSVVRSQLKSQGPDSLNNNPFYTFGRSLKNVLSKQAPTWFGRNFNTPVSATLGGAGIGAGVGALGNYLLNTVAGTDIDPIIGGTVGAGLGAGLGYLTNQYNPLQFANGGIGTPVSNTTGGAAIGGLLGTLGGAAVDYFSDDEEEPGINKKLIGGLIGAGLGGLLGYYTNQQDFNRYLQGNLSTAVSQQAPAMPGINKESSVLNKQGSMFKDPRNFILEKLQRASDISSSDKAILASKVRNMSVSEASDLEKSVRAALGIGVGSLIAKFFGLGPMGTLLSSLIGVAGANIMGVGSSLFSSNNNIWGNGFNFR